MTPDSINRLALHLEQAVDWGQEDEIRMAAHALLVVARERWRCPSCGVERTGSVCQVCRVARPKEK